MKKTDTLVKIISVLALIAIVCYIGYYIYDAQANPLRTVAAVEYTDRLTAPTSGWAVRSEELLTGDLTRTAVAVGEGEKLAKGGTYARRFSSRESMEAMAEIHTVEARISWLETLSEEGDGAGDRMARQSAAALSHGVNSGSMTGLSDLIDDVRVKVFGSEDFTHESIVTQLSEEKDRLARLESALDLSVEQLRTDRSGVFSSYTDGFEAVTPEDVRGVEPEKLKEIFSQPDELPGNVIGKLVTDIRWRYAAILDEKDANNLREGVNYRLEFTDSYNGSVIMTAETISPAEGGKCVVLFVSDRALADTIGLRELTADIVFSKTTGIRIPKDAVYVDEDGQNYVYIISGVQAERVNIEILSETGDYYLAEGGADLRDGMEIITQAEDLYSGKVVRQ